MISLSIRYTTDDQASQVAIKIFLKLSDLCRLRSPGIGRCYGTVYGAALDGTARDLGLLQACSCITSSSQLCLQGLDLSLGSSNLRTRLICLRLKPGNFSIPFFQLLLKCTTLLPESSLSFQLGSERCNQLIRSYDELA
jgi:hypothetical protein